MHPSTATHTKTATSKTGVPPSSSLADSHPKPTNANTASSTAYRMWSDIGLGSPPLYISAARFI